MLASLLSYNTGPTMKHDAFICHAHDDKRRFVKKFADDLISKGCTVWYDEYALRGGESLREAIDRGLGASRFGLVVLSSNFFQRGWPKAELDGMFVEDARRLGNHIIPIWFDVTVEEVKSYSPILAGRHALITKHVTQEVVEKTLLRIRPDLTEQLKTRPFPSPSVASVNPNPYNMLVALTETNLAKFFRRYDGTRDWVPHLPVIKRFYHIAGINSLNQLDTMLNDSFSRELLNGLYDRIFGREVDTLGLVTWMPFIYLKNKEGVETVERYLLSSEEFTS